MAWTGEHWAWSTMHKVWLLENEHIDYYQHVVVWYLHLLAIKVHCNIIDLIIPQLWEIPKIIVCHADVFSSSLQASFSVIQKPCIVSLSYSPSLRLLPKYSHTKQGGQRNETLSERAVAHRSPLCPCVFVRWCSCLSMMAAPFHYCTRPGLESE